MIEAVPYTLVEIIHRVFPTRIELIEAFQYRSKLYRFI